MKESSKFSIVKELEQDFQNLLQDRFDEAKEIEKAKITPFLKDEWIEIERKFKENFDGFDAANVNSKKLKELAKFLYDVPEEFKLFKKTRKLLSDRKKMIEENLI